MIKFTDLISFALFIICMLWILVYKFSGCEFGDGMYHITENCTGYGLTLVRFFQGTVIIVTITTLITSLHLMFRVPAIAWFLLKNR